MEEFLIRLGIPVEIKKKVSDNHRHFYQEFCEPTKQLLISAVIVVVVFAIFLARLWVLQIISGEKYREQSEENRIRTEAVSAPRGIIYDRNGRILVENRAAFNIAVVPGDVEDMKSTLIMLTQITGIPLEKLDMNLKKKRKGPYSPVVLAEDVDWLTLSKIKSDLFDLPGVIVQVEPKRHYLFPGLASHVIGYIAKVNEKELRSRAYSVQYRIGDSIGRAGIEKVYESSLVGQRGYKQVEVDAKGRRLNVLGEELPLPGKSVFLSIDADLQRAAEECLKDKAGAIVAIDPRNGDVLAMASSPGYDQNLFVRHLSAEEWQQIQSNPLHPLRNRAVMDRYPPGSTYKVILAAAGLQEGVITPETTFFCPGFFKLGRRTYHCWKRGGHGNIKLYRALVESCDVYFYQLGLKLGVDRIAKYARDFGLGEKTGVDLDREIPGLVPTSRWKKKRFGVPWQKGETLSIAIGQGFDAVTPLQMTMVYAAIANGGILWQPRIVKRVEDAETQEIEEYGARAKRKVDVSSSYLSFLRKALEGVVEDPHGTGRIARIKGIQVAGKTGTAQVVGSLKTVKKGPGEERFKDHAWFICFAPVENPTIVVGVLVEHGGHGSSGAAPLARRVLEAYFFGSQSHMKVAMKKEGRL